jgi:hypothetical protein
MHSPCINGQIKEGYLERDGSQAVVVSNERWRHFVLAPLIGVYLLSMIITLSYLGETIPFMGNLYSGDDSESLIFANSVISLYLIFGILKRQRLTLWLLIAYNFVNSFNGIANLILLPVQQITTVSGTIIPDYHYRINAFWVFVLFLLLNVFLYLNRDNFDNKSIYLL